MRRSRRTTRSTGRGGGRGKGGQGPQAHTGLSNPTPGLEGSPSETRYIRKPEEIRRGKGPPCLVPLSIDRPPSPVLLQQWLKHWEDLFDNQAIALSGRMNAVGLIERGRGSHTIEKKWNQRQVILLREGLVERLKPSGIVLSIIRGVVSSPLRRR